MVWLDLHRLVSWIEDAEAVTRFPCRWMRLRQGRAEVDGQWKA